MDWARQIADGSIVITETPTTGNIQASSLTVGNITLTGSATGNFGGSVIIGTSPISVSTASGTSTISLNANYQTAGSYVNKTGDTMSGQLYVSSATTTTTVGFGDIIFAKNTSYGSIAVNAPGDNLHIRSKNAVEVISQTGPTPVSLRAKSIGVNSSTTSPTLVDDGITFGDDVNLYRSGANALKTDDALEVVGALTNGGTSVSLSTHTHAGIGVSSVSGTLPITTSGTTAVTVAINQGSTSSAGVLQLTDSINSPSTTTAATPNSVYTLGGIVDGVIGNVDNLTTNVNGRISVSTVTAKGDLIVASGNAVVARLGVGTNGQILTADSSATNGIKWATVAAGGVASVSGTAPITTSGSTAITVAINQGSTSAVGALQLTDSANSTSTTTAATPNAVLQSMKNYQASAYNSTTRIGNVPSWYTSTNLQTATSGRVEHTKHIPERNFTVSNLSFICGTAASGVTVARFGIYTRSGTTFTLVARTANDTTIFNANGTRFTRALDTTGGYPATYDFVAGNEYWVSIIIVATGAPTFVIASTGNTTTNAAFGAYSYAQTGQTDLPATSTGTSGIGRFYSEVS